MLSENVPLDSKHAETAPLSSDENINIRVNLAQIDQLRLLGVLDDSQAEAGRKAGGLDVILPAELVAKFRQERANTPAFQAGDVLAHDATSEEIEKLAQRIYTAGLTTPARLFLAAGKPLSFFGSQMLLLAQPASKLLFREQDPTGQYSRLLEDRANVDRLLRRLDALEAAKKTANAARKTNSKEFRKVNQQETQKENSRL